MSTNGYTQIKINNQEIGIKFASAALLQIREKVKGNPMLFSGDELTQADVAHLIYAGYCNNCLRKDEQPSIPFEDFFDFVEQSTAEVLRTIMECYMGSPFVAPYIDKAVVGTGEQAKEKAKAGNKKIARKAPLN
ncbi:MAG: hypothetical protein WKF97_13910 [Chitinophagaceae bacterium]